MRRALLILKLVVTVVLLGAVLAAADLAALARLLGDASLWLVAAAVALLAVQTLVLSARFHAIVAALGRPISFRSAVDLSFVGVLFNQALPSAIGGDAVRVWRLRADGRPWRDAVNAVLLDRGGGVVVLAVLAAVAVQLEPSGAFRALRGPLWLVAAAGIVAVGIAALSDRAVILPAAVRRALAASGIPAGVRVLFGTRAVIGTTLLSAASHLLATLAVYWLALAIGIHISPGAFFAATLCMLLSMMIPLSYAGWGIREAGAVWLFARVGVDTESALALSVLFGAALLVAALPGIAFWLAPSSGRISAIPPAGTP